MRRTPVLLAAIALAGAASPAAVLAHNPKGDDHPSATHPAAKAPPKGALHLVKACVTENADQSGVAVRVLSANRAMRKALAGEDEFTAALDANTKIRLVGKARIRPAGSTPRLLPRTGTWDDLDQGDLVVIRYRVKRGTALADLGAAWRVTDRGPAKRCAVPAPAPPAPTTEAPAS